MRNILLPSTTAEEQNQNTFIGKECEIELHAGDEVFELLAERSIQSGWDTLYDLCPWSTVFQSRSFVTTWYQIYGKEYEPILIKSVEEGKLNGLLTLARNKKGLIFGAGESQSEYHVWLATDVNGEIFIRKALVEIFKRFKGCQILLKYIPGKAPMKWVKQDPVLKKRCIIRACKQPLMKIDGGYFTSELRKKNRREKINRLKRKGELKFERVTDIKAFSSILEELIIQFDFRKMAMYNTSFFLNDSRRKKFLVSLFQQDLLHATVLRLNEEIIASNVGATGNSWVHLQGINTHSPSYAKYSPGILHFLMLGKLLADEGIAIFDLTPGEDAYKDELATHYDLTHEIRIFGSWSDHIKSTFFQHFKKVMWGIGIKPATLRKIKKRSIIFREQIAHAKKDGILVLMKSIIKQAGLPEEAREYVAQLDEIIKLPNLLGINKNSLLDLLEIETHQTLTTRREFLENAMHRFEALQSVYTFCKDGLLLCCVWLSYDNSTTSSIALLQGFYCHPFGRTLLQSFVVTVAAALTAERKESHIYAITTSRDKMYGQELEAIGFKSLVNSPHINKL